MIGRIGGGSVGATYKPSPPKAAPVPVTQVRAAQAYRSPGRPAAFPAHSAPAAHSTSARSAPSAAPSARLAAAVARRSTSHSAGASGGANHLAARIAAALKIVETAGASLGLLPPNIGSPYGFRDPNERVQWLPNEGFVYPHTTIPDSLPGRPSEGHQGHYTQMVPVPLAPLVPGVLPSDEQFLHGFGYGSKRGFNDLGLARPHPGNFNPLGRRSALIQYE